MLTHNYLLPHYSSYLQLFTLTLNYIFSLNILEAIDYDSAFTTQLPAKLAEYSKFRITNHALLSVQFTAHHVLVLALIR